MSDTLGGADLDFRAPLAIGEEADMVGLELGAFPLEPTGVDMAELVELDAGWYTARLGPDGERAVSPCRCCIRR